MSVMNENKYKIRIETWILILAVCTLIWQVYESNKQSKMHFFTIYTQRYQDIVINFPTDMDSDEFSLSTLDKKERESLLRWIRAYYLLCSEEYHLYHDGLVDKEVWKLWEAGMTVAFRNSVYKEAWGLIQSSP